LNRNKSHVQRNCGKAFDDIQNGDDRRGTHCIDSRSDYNKRARSSSSSQSTEKRLKQYETEWPPCFSTHGTFYVLDSRSGMFYDHRSNFFYDPQTKLYYGNHQKAYFRYDDSQKKNPFVRVDYADNQTKSGNSINEVAITDAVPSASGDYSRKANGTTIAIKIKSEMLVSSSADVVKPIADHGVVANIATTDDVATSQLQKKHANDISKWTARKSELENASLFTDASTIPPTNAVPTSTAFSFTRSKTKNGHPVCLVCQRKFASLEKLHYHEQVSELHKTNVAKRLEIATSKKSDALLDDNCIVDEATCDSIKDPEPSMLLTQNVYVDRAHQRRLQQNMELSVQKLMPMNESAQTAEVDCLSLAKDNIDLSKNELGSDHIGHQMLCKLGWQHEHVLGRRSQMSEIKSDPATSGNPLLNQQVALKKDWDRIEALAAGEISRTKKNNYLH
jgi:hypothetical protein